MFAANDPSDELARSLESLGRDEIRDMPPELAALERFELLLLPFAPMGIAHLRRMFDAAAATSPGHGGPSQSVDLAALPLSSLVAELERQGHAS